MKNQRVITEGNLVGEIGSLLNEASLLEEKISVYSDEVQSFKDIAARKCSEKQIDMILANHKSMRVLQAQEQVVSTRLAVLYGLYKKYFPEGDAFDGNKDIKRYLEGLETKISHGINTQTFLEASYLKAIFNPGI